MWHNSTSIKAWLLKSKWPESRALEKRSHCKSHQSGINRRVARENALVKKKTLESSFGVFTLFSLKYCILKFMYIAQNVENPE